MTILIPVYPLFQALYGRTDNSPYSEWPHLIKGCMNEDGDIAVVVKIFPDYLGNFCATGRDNGVWRGWNSISNGSTGKWPYWISSEEGSLGVMRNKMSVTQLIQETAAASALKKGCGGGGGATWAKPEPECKNFNLVCDGDWMFTSDWSSNNYLGLGKNYANYNIFIDRNQQAESQLWYSIIGGGSWLPKWTYYPDAMMAYVKLTNTDLMITSVKDFTAVNENITMERARGMAAGSNSDPSSWNGNPIVWDRQDAYNPTGTIARDVADNTFGESIAYTYLYKPVGKPVMLSTYDGKYAHFYRMREDMAIKDGIFAFGEKWVNKQPLALCGNSTYLFAFNANQIFISPQVGDWAKPTAGTGAGGYLEIDTPRVISLNETVISEQTSSLEIVLNNYDGYYDAPETGELDHIKKGSRVNLYLGYEVGGVEEISQYAQWFLVDWGYTRQPNASYFTLKCTNAWGLLDNYVFPTEAQFNQYEDATNYSVYQIMEMLIQSIGGTLSYETKSADIDTIYPRIKIRTGDTAGSVMRRMLNQVPDKIKFTGNNGTILNPQDTDTPVYNLQFPVRVI